MSEKFTISDEQIAKQADYTRKVNAILSSKYYNYTPKAYVHTYGCQGNVSDSERIKGMLCDMGYEFTDSLEQADFVLYNTCAVREHAEDRVFGNVGILKKYKEEKKSNLIIALCGCMMQQEHIREKIYKSYPYVDLVFGTHATYRLPELIFSVLSTKKRVVCAPDAQNEIAENIPVYRDPGYTKAWLPIMYGCDNFCTYCIVPYVRGREISREPEEIIKEAKQIIKDGYREITLLGQNVNSYGKNNKSNMNFAGLLRELNSLDGDFVLRFMTSHPKDCTKELIDTIAECDKVAKHIHLPVQSGNNRILKAMNRHYNVEQYLELVDYAKLKIPNLSLTSDIIVGFPGETHEEFLDTVSLIKRVEFTSLFTFIYSPRKGTKAAEMPDPVSKAEKTKWFKELTDAQEQVAADRTSKMMGKTFRVFAEEKSKTLDGYIQGRTDGNVIIEFPSEMSVLGSFCNVKVTETLNWILRGEKI